MLNRAQSCGLAEKGPLIAIATDAVFEDERLGAGGYLGAAIVMVGLAVTLRRGSGPPTIATDR